ncbi:MAG: type VI secretion system baseplate subunit TssF [Syntrophaceae bacterium]|nr:type VI secretion system baseplate subunit TssF [Syntrophaceae bacterium]
MINRYFQQEMNQLRELGASFAKAYPALAPMLSGPAADPDVERLLEGVSFQTALLRQKLDDDFPEIIQDLVRIIWPHYLRPIPSTSTVVFTPKATLRQPATIPAGTPLASLPVDGTPCLFRTCSDVEIHPLTLLEAAFEQPPGRPPQVRLLMELVGLRLSDWRPESLRFFLAGDYAEASDLYFLLMRHLKRVVLEPLEGGDAAALPPECLRDAGFSEQAALVPYPSHAFPGYRVLQEYFVSPEKFLYVGLSGWDRWRDRGGGSKFEVRFEFDALPVRPARLGRDDVALHATPVVNLFAHEADPIALDHRRPWYPVRPAGYHAGSGQVYAVDAVTGFIQGSAAERRYLPFEHFNPDVRSTPVYHTTCRRSPVGPGADVFLSVAYPPEAGVPRPETLSVELTCTNGTLPESLRVGDICVATGASPEFATFRNIKPLTPAVFPPLSTNFLWRLVSHLSLNYLSLAHPDRLRALLDLYVFPECRDRSAVLANRKRIAGIEQVEDRPSDRLVGGLPVRGREVTFRLRRDHYVSTGDLFLFGSVLDVFLGGYASVNSFTSLGIRETMKGETYRWPARLGNHPLI